MHIRVWFPACGNGQRVVVFDRDEGFVYELGQLSQNARLRSFTRDRNRLGRLQTETAPKDRQPSKRLAHFVRQQFITPIDRGAQGLVTGTAMRLPEVSKSKAVIQTLGQLFGGENVHTGGSQLPARAGFHPTAGRFARRRARFVRSERKWVARPRRGRQIAVPLRCRQGFLRSWSDSRRPATATTTRGRARRRRRNTQHLPAGGQNPEVRARA